MYFSKLRKVSSNRRHVKGLQVEGLEDRQLMAADIMVDVAVAQPAEAIQAAFPIVPVVDPFVGTWTNVNDDTRGITKITVTKGSGGHKIEAWGACTPTDCDWGKTDLELLGTNVSDKKPDYAIGNWDMSFKETTITLDLTSDGMIADVYNVFTDGSARENYHQRYLLDDSGKMVAMPDFGNNQLADVIVGGWVNRDAHTNGLTKAIIGNDPGTGHLQVNAFGQCTPDDCNWGVTDLNVVGSSVNDKSPEYAVANYDFDFKTTFVTTRFEDGELIVSNYNVFTDGSDRSNYMTEYHMWKLGDANHDGEFNSSDLVQLFQAGEYEDGDNNNSTWEEGDFDRDGDFTTSDLIAAFEGGGYEAKPWINIVRPKLPELKPLPKFDPSIRFTDIATAIDDIFASERTLAVDILGPHV